MKVFDSHVHFWDLSLGKNAWLIRERQEDGFLGDLTPICQNYLPDDLRHDAETFELIGVTHVQAGWDAADPTGETRWLTELHDRTQLPQAIVGYADLTAKDVQNVLEKHRAQSNFRGIRQIINWHDDPFFSGCAKDIVADPNFKKGFRLLGNLQLSFDLQAYSQQLLQLIPLLKQHDHIPIVIEHCGMPLFLGQHDVDNWKKVLRQAAQLPHIAIKLSGFGMFARYSDQFLSAKDIVAFCLETFGVHRCLFGSNFPADRLYGHYADTLQPVLAQGLSKMELQSVLCDNAIGVYRYEN